MAIFRGITRKNGTQYSGIDGARQSKSWGSADEDPKPLRALVLLQFVSVIAGFFWSCSRGGPEAIADRFMESYYAAANLEDALQLAEGLAAKKIRDQQVLRQGQTGPQTTQGRRVSFNRTEKATVEGKLFLRYEVQIDIQGGGSFTRKSLLALSQGPNGWRVTNFSEND